MSQLETEGGSVMKIIIKHDGKGLNIDFSTKDWDHYRVLGVLEQAKWVVQKEIDEMRKMSNGG